MYHPNTKKMKVKNAIQIRENSLRSQYTKLKEVLEEYRNYNNPEFAEDFRKHAVLSCLHIEGNRRFVDITDVENPNSIKLASIKGKTKRLLSTFAAEYRVNENGLILMQKSITGETPEFRKHKYMIQRCNLSDDMISIKRACGNEAHHPIHQFINFCNSSKPENGADVFIDMMIQNFILMYIQPFEDSNDLSRVLPNSYGNNNEAYLNALFINAIRFNRDEYWKRLLSCQYSNGTDITNFLDFMIEKTIKEIEIYFKVTNRRLTPRERELLFTYYHSNADTLQKLFNAYNMQNMPTETGHLFKITESLRSKGVLDYGDTTGRKVNKHLEDRQVLLLEKAS